MKEHLIVVPGQPKGKGRPRFTTANGYHRTFTPPETQRYEELIRTCFYEQVTEPVHKERVYSVHVVAVFKIPESASKKTKEHMKNGEIRATVKPDLDNVLKIVLDALNGVAFVDDRQIVHLWASKYYGEQPKLLVQIVEEDEDG